MKNETKKSVLRIIMAAVVLALLVFVIAYQNRDRSLGGEIVDILGSGRGADENRSVEGYAGGAALTVGKKALLLTTNTFLLMDENGRGSAKDISIASPAAWAEGEYIVVYDREGRDFSLYKDDKQIYALRTEYPIISAKVNKNGYAFVAGEPSGGGAEIRVYNDKGAAIYAWNMGSGEFVDMDLSADNSRLVISSVSDAEDELRGELTVVRLDKTERQAAGFQEDEIYFNVKINRDYTISALGSERLALYNSDGALRWELGYDGRTLLGADISNPDAMIICCESAASGLMGKSTQIEMVNRMGEVTASTEMNGLCEALSVSGGHIAASAGNRVFIYNEKCQLQKELLSDFAVKRMALFSSGKAAFVMSGSAGNIIK